MRLRPVATIRLVLRMNEPISSGFPNLSSSQTFDGNEHHLLREIVGGHVIVKVPHTEQTDLPRKPSIQLTFFGRGRVTRRRRRHFTSEVAVW